jgi:hypothetical protein
VLVIRGFVEPVLSSNPAKLRGAGKAQPRLCPCAVSLVGRHAAASSACAPRKGAVDFPGGTQRRRLRPAAANCDHSTFRPLGGVVWGDGKAVLAGSRDTGGARVAAGTRVRGVCHRRVFESSLRTNGRTLSKLSGSPDRAFVSRLRSPNQSRGWAPSVKTNNRSVADGRSSSLRAA